MTYGARPGQKNRGKKSLEKAYDAVVSFRHAVLSSLFLVLVPRTSLAAAHEVKIDASGGLEALRVSVDDKGNFYGATATKPEGFVYGGGDPVVEAVSVGEHRRVAHVVIPSANDGVSWELVVAPSTGAAPTVLYSGLTGYAHGEDGERTGDVVTFLGDGADKVVVVGRLREDVRICGEDATVLDPLALDAKTMQLRGASMQRLSKAERANASKIVATPHGGTANAPLAPLLVASGSSNDASAARAIADGDTSTTWSEARPGAGAGEFVVLRAPAEIPITRLEITPAPPSSGTARATGAPTAAPRSFYLATDKKLFQITMPEDAAQHPGATYDIAFAEPIASPCIAVVLDEAYSKEAHPVVAVAEVTAFSSFDAPGATLDDVAKALSGGSARSQAAAALLKRAGDRGLAAVDQAWAKLDTPGRALATDVATSAGCAASPPLLIRAMLDRDREVRRKGEEALDRCGRAALPALAKVVGEGDEHARAIERAAFMRAVHITDPKILPPILSDASRSEIARIDLLRASTARLPEIPADAFDAIDAALKNDSSFRTRYLLLGPLAALARKSEPRASALFVSMLAKDADAPVRMHAAELAGNVPAAQGALLAALSDAEPRVRDAALRTIADEHASPATVAIEHLLEKDPWPFVRASAATALGAFPSAVDIDRSLAASLRDSSARVRTAAIDALGSHRARSFAPQIAEHADDENEPIDVRLAAVRALGSTCDASSLGRLGDFANKLVSPMADDTQVALGFGAIEAIGAIHPADIARRLGNLTANGVRAAVRKQALEAIASPGACR